MKSTFRISFLVCVFGVFAHALSREPTCPKFFSKIGEARTPLPLKSPSQSGWRHFDQAVAPVFKAAEAFPKITAKMAKSTVGYLKDLSFSGGLRFFLRWEKASEGAELRPGIWGGLFSEPEKFASRKDWLFQRLMSGDSWAQLGPRALTRAATGRALDFTPSVWLANRTRIRPGHYDGNPGVRFAMPVHYATAMGYSTLTTLGIYWSVLEFNHFLNRGKRDEEFLKDSEKWKSEILFNAQFESLLFEICKREGVSCDLTLEAKQKDLEKKITLEDMKLASKYQESLLNLVDLLKEKKETPFSDTEIASILEVSDSSDPYGVFFSDLKKDTKSLRQKNDSGSLAIVRRMFTNRIQKALVEVMVPLAMQENWLQKNPDSKVEPGDKIKNTKNPVLAPIKNSSLVQQAGIVFQDFKALQTLTQLARGDFDDPNTKGYTIDKKFFSVVEDPPNSGVYYYGAAIPFYLQKLMNATWDAEYEVLAQGLDPYSENAEEFTAVYSKALQKRNLEIFEELFKRYGK